MHMHMYPGPDRLVEIVNYVRKCKSMYVAIRNEVDNWLMRFKLLNTVMPELNEEPPLLEHAYVSSRHGTHDSRCCSSIN